MFVLGLNMKEVAKPDTSNSSEGTWGASLLPHPDVYFKLTNTDKHAQNDWTCPNMLLKHSVMLLTTGSDLPLGHNGGKNTNHLFL